jgi:hypothetical protein
MRLTNVGLGGLLDLEDCWDWRTVGLEEVDVFSPHEKSRYYSTSSYASRADCNIRSYPYYRCHVSLAGKISTNSDSENWELLNATKNVNISTQNYPV